MNFFASANSSDGLSGVSLLHSDSHLANAVVVPDANLLVHGHYHRAGLDLVLTGQDGRHHVVAGYFANEHPPTLMSPDGAHLSADVVEMLAGSPAPGEYAQAQTQTQTSAPPDSIAKIQKVAGSVTVVRNGVSVALNVGDVVYKTDVIVTATDSKVGLTFPDGTALELLPNTRMALNEYIYDANSTSNKALFTLVEGTFGFVAGKVAHTGDMSIGTPVATMGIRGTTGVVQQVNSPNGTITYSYSVYDDPGTTHSGSWDMFVQNADGTETLVATVSQTGYVTFVTPQGLGLPPLVTTVPLTASQANADQLIIVDLAELAGLGGPHSLGSPGSGDDPLLRLPINFLQDLGGVGGSGSFNFTLPPLPGPTAPQNPQQPNFPGGNSNIFIWSIGQNQGFPTGHFWNQGFGPTSPNDIVIIESGEPQYNELPGFTFYSLTIDAPGTLDMIGGALTITNGLDVFGVLLLEGDPPIFTSYGPATIESGGKVIVTGAGAVVDFSPNLANPITAPVEVENFGKIVAKFGGDIEFIDAIVKNEAANAGNTDPNEPTPAGRIKAVGEGAIVDFTNVTFDNAGIVVAKDTGESGGVFFVNTNLTNEVGARITAKDFGSITFATSDIVGNPLGIVAKVDNFGLIDAKSGGDVTFEIAVTNESGARIASSGCDSLISFTGDEIDNFGVVRAAWDGTVKFVGADIINEAADTGTTPTQPGGKIEAKDGGHIEILGGRIGNFSGAVITATEHGSIYFATTDSANPLGVTNYDGGKITAVDCGTITFKDVGLFNNTDAMIEAKDRGTVTFIETKNSHAGITNAGTIKAEDRGIVTFVDVGVGTSGGVINDGGLIEAIGCGAKIDLIDSTIVGGTLQTRDGGKFEAVYGRSTFLNVLINGGIVAADWRASLALQGDTVVDKTVTFEGAGTFELKGSDKITGGDAHALLKNDSTIAGSGTIGGNGLTLINENCGTILATGGFGHTLTIDTGSNKVTNDGLLEAIWFSKLDIESKLVNSGRVVATYGGKVVVDANVVNKHGALIEAEYGGTVTLDDIKITNESCAVIEAKGGYSTVFIDSSTVDNHGTIEAKFGGTVSIADSTINNECGLIAAYGFGATVELKNTTISGGTLATGDPCSPCFGVIEITSPHHGGTNTVIFDGSGQEVTIDGFVKVDRGATLELVGTIDNDGTIDVDPASGPGATLTIDGTVYLDGDGAVTLDGRGDSITGVKGTDATLYNDSNIDGAGRIGGNGLILINQDGGHIVADGGECTMLVIDTGRNRITNDGVMEAVCLSELDIESKLVNYGRVIAAFGGTVVVADDVVNEAGARIVAKSGGTVTLDGIKVTNDGGGCEDNPGGVIVARGEGSEVSMACDTIDNAGTIAARKGGIVDVFDTVIQNDGGHIDSSGFGSVIALADSKVIDGDISITGRAHLDFEGTSDTLNDVGVSVGDHGDIFVGETTDGGTVLTLTHGTEISGGTLTIAKGSEVEVESSEGATLDGVYVFNHGTIQVDCDEDETPTVPLILEGGTIIKGGELSVGNHGVLDVESYFGATLDHVTVDVGRRGNIEVVTTASGSILTLEDDTVISGGTLTIDKGSELAVESHKGATLDGVDVVNHGTIQVDCADERPTVPLVLNGGTAITGGELDVGSKGLLDIESSAGATLDGVTVYLDGRGQIEVGAHTASGSILMLDHDTVISGGALTIESQSKLDIETKAGATLDGVHVVDDGTINVDPGKAVLTLDGGTTIDGDGTLNIGPDGTVDVTGDGSTICVDVVNNGHLNVQDATLTVNGAVCGTGTDTISNHGVLDFTSIVSAGQTVSFADGTGTLQIANHEDFSATISHFGNGDTIDLQDIAYQPGSESDVWVQTSTGHNAGGTLTIYDGSAAVETLYLLGTYSTNDFELVGDQSDGTSGGTDVVWTNAVSGKTATFSNGTILFENSHWVVDDGIVTLDQVNSAVIDDDTYLLVGAGGYTNLKTALNHAQSGDTIELAPGTYSETITDSLSHLTIVAPDGATDSSNIKLSAGVVLSLDGVDATHVTFTGGTGELVLSDLPSSYSATIDGFTGTAADVTHSDAIDLAGFAVQTEQQYSTNSGTILMLDLSDGSGDTVDLAFDNFHGTLDVQSDGHGGTLITDPPAPDSALPTPSIAADDASGVLTFADADSSDAVSASVTPEGQNYLGELKVGAVTESNGTASIDYGFSLGNDQINVAPGQTVTQSYQVSLADAQNPAANTTQTVAVSIGGAGNDNFVFAPGVGHDTILNFNPQQDTIELDHFANVQSVQELQSLITADAHGNAFIDLGNHDSITVEGMTPAQLQASLQSLVHLH